MSQEEGLSEFLKLAYASDRVKELNEAFKEFPVEEENHKGKVEYFLEEDSKQYTFYNVGDIVFVKNYLYADGKIGTNHLFVLIEEDHIAVPIEYIGMLLSSHIDKLKFKSNSLLEKDINNNLTSDSIVKMDVVYKISNKQILFKIGEVDKDKIKEYKEYFLKNFNK